jgi:glucosylceramidase
VISSYVTQKDTPFKLVKKDLLLRSNDRPAEITVQIDLEKTGQTILGFGGAFTEASAYNLSRIDRSIRDRAIKAYFDPDEGLGYTLGRVSIHGCDFSLGSYLYIDDYDDTLESFSVDRDRAIIDLIKQASMHAKTDIRILASPWTPPFWMKDNRSPIRGGKLLPEYDQTWAEYFVKFIRAYESHGIDIFAVTVQNEPQASQRWDSCIYDDADELRFVKVLGRTFEREKLKQKIYIWDHNRDGMVARAKAIYSDPEATRYVHGTAFHWYDNEQFAEVEKHRTLFPDKHLLFTEGCQEYGPHFGDYSVGERYGRNMIHDLQNGTEGYIDWNLFLDDTGGPNHVNNLCSAPMMIKIFNEELVHMPAYYYIGHFSKFIRPGAVRIRSDVGADTLCVVFKNVDESVVIVYMNESDEDERVQLEGAIQLTFLAGKRSISTIVLKD